jgi:5-hydroxyisourate hydrolase
MSGISTHVLDTAAGRPVSGIAVRLFRDGKEVGFGVTNADGRCATLLHSSALLQAGVYRLFFDIEKSFPGAFYPEISICFRVADADTHYHVPVLLSPFGYTTYRGS